MRRMALTAMTLVTAAFMATAAAQQNTSLDSSAMLAKIQADKREIVGQELALTPAEAAVFWPLYDTFQRELELVNSRYRRAILDYVAAEGKLTDANADRLARQALEAGVEEARLRQRHYEKLKRKIAPAKAARYAQIESKIQAVQRFETAKALPLIK